MIVDAHCHILPPSFIRRREELAARDATFAEILADPSARMADVDSLLNAMTRDGVDHAVVMGMGWTDPEVSKEANDYIIEAALANPDHLTGFLSVNPAWGEAALREVERCAYAGLRGIGELHPDTQAVDITDASTMAPMMDLARSLNLPLLLHCSEPVGHVYPGKGITTPDRVWRLIENFPDNTIICAHWGGGLPFYALMPEVGASLSNVYFDSAASPFLYLPSIFSATAKMVGADRILFASDYPLMPPSRPLTQVMEQPLEEEHRHAILGKNAARMLGFGQG